MKWVSETDPELLEKIERRYPNAYLILLYWDSEMFKRHSRKRGGLEKELQPQVYKSKLYDLLFLNTQNYTIPPDTLKTLKDWRRLVKGLGIYMTQKLFRTSYEAILSGDPKQRTFRAVYNEVYSVMSNISREEQRLRDEKQNI